MGHLHRITKLYVSNSPWPLPFPITDKDIQNNYDVINKLSKILFQSFKNNFLTNQRNIIKCWCSKNLVNFFKIWH